MPTLRLCAFLGAVLLLAVGSARAQTARFGFERVDLATPTPLLSVAADNGAPLTADFESLGNGTDAEPDAFFVGDNGAPPAQFSNMFRHILSQPGAFSTVGFDTLQIRFSAPISSLRLDFGLSDPGALQLCAAALTCISQEAMFNPALGSLEGSLSFDAGAATFDTVALSTLAPAGGGARPQFFSIDNVTTPAVPEPGLLVFGLAALAVAAGRFGFRRMFPTR